MVSIIVPFSIVGCRGSSDDVYSNPVVERELDNARVVEERSIACSRIVDSK